LKGGHNMESIGDAVYRVEFERFGVGALESLIEFLPQGDEIDALQAFTESSGDISLLGPAESFVLALKDIPRLNQRIRTLMFAATFDESINDIKSATAKIQDACKSIRNSSKFGQFLGIVLRVGNELNKGTEKGDAKGIHLGSLIKLTQTKSNSSSTLLEYLVKNLDENDPDVLNLVNDFDSLASASKCNLQTLGADVNKFKSSFTTIDVSLTSAQKSGDDENFVVAASGLLSACKPELDRIETDFKEMNATFKELCGYLGEDPTIAAPEELFGQVNAFVSVLRSTVFKVREIKERQRKRDDQHKYKTQRGKSGK